MDRVCSTHEKKYIQNIVEKRVGKKQHTIARSRLKGNIKMDLGTGDGKI
jgi:hypothetical protein